MTALKEVVLQHGAFRDALIRALGKDRVLAEPQQIDSYLQNVSGFQRDVPLVAFPQNAEEVAGLVKLANQYQVPLYPISTGRNWGLGSKLPVKDGCVIVDLSRMDRIHSVDQIFGVAVIEPGVTQGQLSEQLEKEQSPFFVDVTGSGRHTSILGNILDRGVGYNTFRADNLITLEVVLGDGRVVKTGYSHYPDAKLAHLSAYGIGPNLSALFQQSNFGIVTQATIRLLPRPQETTLFALEVAPGKLGEAVDGLRKVKQAGVSCIVHIGNRQRRAVSLAPMIFDYYQAHNLPISRDEAEKIVARNIRGDWAALGHVSGTPAQCREYIRIVRSLLSPHGKVTCFNRTKISVARTIGKLFRLHDKSAMLSGLEELYGVMKGKPTDMPLKSIHWPMETSSRDFREPDKGEGGLIFAVPTVPMDGKSAHELVEIAEQVSKAHGFTVAITLNTIHAHMLEGVVSVDFPRKDKEQSARAAEWLKALHEACIKQGIYPLRSDIENMQQFLSETDPFWQAAKDIKQALDPNGIIAPGRYCIE